MFPDSVICPDFRELGEGSIVRRGLAADVDRLPVTEIPPLLPLNLKILRTHPGLFPIDCWLLNQRLITILPDNSSAGSIAKPSGRKALLSWYANEKRTDRYRPQR